LTAGGEPASLGNVDRLTTTDTIKTGDRALLTSCDEAVVLTVGPQVGPREFADLVRELAPGTAPSDSDDSELAGVPA
jgi:hypothetical protein